MTKFKQFTEWMSVIEGMLKTDSLLDVPESYFSELKEKYQMSWFNLCDLMDKGATHEEVADVLRPQIGQLDADKDQFYNVLLKNHPRLSKFLKIRTVFQDIRKRTDGSIVYDHFKHADRYIFDFDLCSGNGWKQYDTNQDAHYFGVWVHVKDRLVVTYCEGDIPVSYSPTVEAFKAELDSMQECYGDPPPAIIGIADNGEVTHYIDERPSI